MNENESRYYVQTVFFNIRHFEISMLEILKVHCTVEL